MKVKEILRTGNVAWSPSDHHPIRLAVGTAAQQLDATFNTTAAIEIYRLDLGESDLDMPRQTTSPSDQRFHKLVWGNHGKGQLGTLVAGGEQGSIYLYDPESLLAGSSDILYKCIKHTGAVRALDFNKFQPNLLASGATESEVLLWDLNNPVNAMAPGSKSMPADDVTSVAWNTQVQHILASTFANRCIVWDLRKNEPIIKVSDSVSRLRCKQVSWHPEVATQMALASEDDHSPVIQIWDLRFATSPVRSLESHQRGVLSIAWCPLDPDLLLSCGKDNRILCWDPNANVQGGEVLYEMPLSSQWSFDVQWCPRNPAIISSCAFDGHISLYSLMGGTHELSDKPQVDISEAFGSVSTPVPQLTPKKVVVPPLKKPPKWLRCPQGVSFAFGGKLVSFAEESKVVISQVITEEELVDRAIQFRNVVQAGSLRDFCATKAASETVDFDREFWRFVGAHFAQDPRGEWLKLLGYGDGALAARAIDVKRTLEARRADPRVVDGSTASPAAAEGEDGSTSSFDFVSSGKPSAPQSENEANSASGSDNGATVVHDDKPSIEDRDQFSDENGSPEGASKKPASALFVADDEVTSDFDNLLTSSSRNPATSAFDNITHAFDADSRIDDVKEGLHVDLRVDNDKEDLEPAEISIPSDLDSVEGLLVQAVLVGDLETAVDICFADDRLADALVLASSGNQALLLRTRQRYLEKLKKRKQDKQIARVMSIVLDQDWDKLITSCNLDNWRQALAGILANSSNGVEKLVPLGNILASRLENDRALFTCACLCYICAGNESKVIELLQKLCESKTCLELHSQVEKITVFSKALANLNISSERLSALLTRYANLLISQGQLQLALSCLDICDGKEARNLKERVIVALRLNRRPSSMTPSKPSYHQATHHHSISSRSRQMSRSSRGSLGQETRQPPEPIPFVNPAPIMQPTSTFPQPPSVPMQNKTEGISSKHTGLKGRPKYPAHPEIMGNSGGYQYSSVSHTNQTSLTTSSLDHAMPSVPMMFPITHQTGMFSPSTATGPTPLETNFSAKPVDSFVPPPLPTIHSTTQFATETHAAISSLPAVPSFQEAPPANLGWNDPPTSQAQNPNPNSQFRKAKDKPTGPVTPMELPPGVLNPAAYAMQHPTPPAFPLQAGFPSAPVLTPPSSNAWTPPSSNGLASAPVEAPAPSQSPALVVKNPLAPEYQLLYDTFSGALLLCQNVSTNPVMKRKLDDVGRKLEILADKLREGTVSPNVFGGLQQMAAAISAKDYQRGLKVYAAIVRGGNFAEISSFMPGLKTLMQSATQLKV